MNNTTERIRANIAKNVREIVQYDLSIESLPFLTVTDVEVSSDHSYCKIYVSFFVNQEQNLQKLNKVKGFVRSQLAKRIHLRRVPEISFVLDKSQQNAERIEKLLESEEKTLEDMKSKK